MSECLRTTRVLPSTVQALPKYCRWQCAAARTGSGMSVTGADGMLSGTSSSSTPLIWGKRGGEGEEKEEKEEEEER